MFLKTEGFPPYGILSCSEEIRYNALFISERNGLQLPEGYAFCQSVEKQKIYYFPFKQH